MKLTDWSGEDVSSAEHFIFDEFPSVEQTDLMEVYEQVVEGKNFRFEFVDHYVEFEEGEEEIYPQYIFMIYQSLEGKNFLISASKSG